MVEDDVMISFSVVCVCARGDGEEVIGRAVCVLVGASEMIGRVLDVERQMRCEKMCVRKMGVEVKQRCSIRRVRKQV